MREFKFRAWDKDFLKMHWFLEKSHNLPTPQPLHWYLENRDRFEIMQFTGLTDKKGKDIYEGDILKINGQIDVSYNTVFNVIEKDKFELISKVVYNDLMACFELETIEPDINVQHWEFYGEGTECFEVIGNIHEKDKL